MRIDRHLVVTYMTEEKCTALVKELNSTEDACGWTYHRDYNQKGWYVRITDENGIYLGTL